MKFTKLSHENVVAANLLQVFMQVKRAVQKKLRHSKPHV